MKTSSAEQQMVEAYRAGLTAARSGQVVSTNPYDPQAPKAVERVCALMWVRGYGKGNPVDDFEDPEAEE